MAEAVEEGAEEAAAAGEAGAPGSEAASRTSSRVRRGGLEGPRISHPMPHTYVAVAVAHMPGCLLAQVAAAGATTTDSSS